MSKLNGFAALQINVPHKHYGECSYFMPDDMRTWMKEHDLRYSLGSQSSSGNGYTDGVTNKESHYSVRGCQPEDATAFAIQFPHCKVHVFNDYDYA